MLAVSVPSFATGTPPSTPEPSTPEKEKEKEKVTRSGTERTDPPGDPGVKFFILKQE